MDPTDSDLQEDPPGEEGGEEEESNEGESADISFVSRGREVKKKVKDMWQTNCK